MTFIVVEDLLRETILVNIGRALTAYPGTGDGKVKRGDWTILWFGGDDELEIKIPFAEFKRLAAPRKEA